jgi:hypothetical protein
MKENRDRSRPITLDIIEEAAEQLILERATHLDQLTDKLREPRVRNVMEAFLAGEMWDAPPAEDDIQYVLDLGLLRRDETRALVLSNDLYREIVPRQLSSVLQDRFGVQIVPAWYVAPDGSLDIKKLLSAFQQFFRENSESWLERFDYKEAGFLLLLQAFLQRVVNGGGLIDREYALGRGRVDLLVRWRYPKDAPRGGQREQRAVLELKTIRASSRDAKGVLSKGLKQTARYAEQSNAGEAHLVVCDERSGRSWDEKIYERPERCADREIRVWGV